MRYERQIKRTRECDKYLQKRAHAKEFFSSNFQK